MAIHASRTEARMLGIDVPKPKRKSKKAKPVLLPPGTVIAEFVVPGRAVPWKAPTVTRHGTFAPKAVGAWKREVAKAAKAAMGEQPPYAGPVEVRFRFELTKQGSTPDTSNLTKASEDACQSVVITNDTNVCRIVSERIADAEIDQTFVTVIAV